MNSNALTFTVRNLKPSPHHSSISSGEIVQIITYDLELNIKDIKQFPTKKNQNISIKSNKLGINWTYGDDDSENNLKGTTCTLDLISGSCPLSDSLISRSGYSVIDSLSPIINENGTFTPASQVTSLHQSRSRHNSPKEMPGITQTQSNHQYQSNS